MIRALPQLADTVRRTLGRVADAACNLGFSYIIRIMHTAWIGSPRSASCFAPSNETCGRQPGSFLTEACDAYLPTALILSRITQILSSMSAKGKEKMTATATDRIDGTSSKDGVLKQSIPRRMQPNTVQRTASFAFLVSACFEWISQYVIS